MDRRGEDVYVVLGSVECRHPAHFAGGVVPRVEAEALLKAGRNRGGKYGEDGVCLNRPPQREPFDATDGRLEPARHRVGVGRAAQPQVGAEQSRASNWAEMNRILDASCIDGLRT